MRVVRVLLVGLVALIACSAAPHTAPAPSRSDIRDGIIRRDIAFAYDTIVIMRFDAPHIYGAIRLQVERCSGLTRDGWPSFYVANINPMPGHVWAFYAEKNKSVVFALGMESVPSTIAHELLHFLLAPHIDPHKRADESHEQWVERTHPAEYFGGKCADLLQHPS